MEMLVKKTRASRQRQPRLRSIPDVYAFVDAQTGVDGVVRWACASDASLTTFYTKLWPKLLEAERTKGVERR
jgi:hypothetical protein